MSYYSTDPSTTPSYTYQQYSSPKANDYYSTSTPTRVQKLSYNSSDYYYYYSTPSLYSREDQINIMRRKQKLKDEIAALRQRYRQLKFEAERIKKEKVSDGEITFLQAETKEEISKNNSEKLQFLLTDLFEQVQSAAAAKAFVSVFNQKLKDEEKQRKYFSDESNAVANLFDFSELKMECPSIRCLDQRIQPSLKEECDQDERNLKKMKNELVCLACPSKLGSVQVEAANSVVKLTNAQCKMSTVGIHILRADVNHLQKAIEEQEMMLKNKEYEICYIRRKLRALEIEEEHTEASQKAQMLSNQSVHQQQFESLDQEIFDFNNKINETAIEHDELNQGIQELQEEKNSLSIRNSSVNQYEESLFIDDELFVIEEEEEEGENSRHLEEEMKEEEKQIQLMNEKISQMKIDKQLLLKEVELLNTQFNETKKKLKSQEIQLKLKIKKLYSKYSANKKRAQEEYIINNSSNSSGIQGEIANVLSNIESSISQLKSEFIEM